MQMLEETLVNDDGTLNEWAMLELSQAIENLPKSFERLAEDSEWNVKKEQWTFAHTITGAFAKYAIIQSPFGIPSGLENVCNFLHAELLKRNDWAVGGMSELSLCEINKLLHDILYDKNIAEFDAWNQTKPDFIDLDALLHNVCLDIRTERREFKAFNEKFDRLLEMETAIQLNEQ